MYLRVASVPLCLVVFLFGGNPRHKNAAVLITHHRRSKKSQPRKESSITETIHQPPDKHRSFQRHHVPAECPPP